MAEGAPLRVLLVGVSSDDLDRLTRPLAGDAVMQIVGTVLLDETLGSPGAAGSPGTSEGVPDIQGAARTTQEAARTARADAVLMTPQALARVQGIRERRTTEEPPTEALTARERDVLGYVAEGHGNREIGQLLGISEHTVKFHLASIYGKLGVGNRTEAVQHALRMGLLEI